MSTNTKIRSGFFTWENHFKKYPEYKNIKLQVVLTERNTGKSTATWEWLIKHSLKPNAQALILRNTDKELEQFIQNVGAFLKTKDMVLYKNHIYQGNFKNGPVVGYLASVNNYLHYKSFIGAKINAVFYEEFNELGTYGKNIYWKFMNLLKSFERFNEIKYLFMVGNKDGFVTDYFVNWEIMPNENYINTTKITEIKNNDEIIGVCVDYGNHEFSGLLNEETLTHKLSQMDYRTANYSKGGYLQNIDKRVVNYKVLLKNNFVPILNFSWEDRFFTYGKTDIGYGVIDKYYIENNKPTISFDSTSFLGRDVIGASRDDLKELLKTMVSQFKTGNLFLSSYEAKEIIRLAFVGLGAYRDVLTT